MKDLAVSVIQNLKERVSSPFSGAYLLSWVVVNYKPVIILFLSDKEIEARLDIMSESSYSIYIMFGLPLAFSFLYLWLSPYLNLFVSKFRDSPIHSSKSLVIKQLTELAKEKIEMVEAETALERKRLELEKDKKQIEIDGKLKELELQDREALRIISSKELENKRIENELKSKGDELNLFATEIEGGKQSRKEELATFHKETKELTIELERLKEQRELFRAELAEIEQKKKDSLILLEKNRSEHEYLSSGLGIGVEGYKSHPTEDDKYHYELGREIEDHPSLNGISKVESETDFLSSEAIHAFDQYNKGARIASRALEQLEFSDVNMDKRASKAISKIKLGLKQSSEAYSGLLESVNMSGVPGVQTFMALEEFNRGLKRSVNGSSELNDFNNTHKLSESASIGIGQINEGMNIISMAKGALNQILYRR